ncbi:MAG: VCBS repeat-containing protein, partial [Acidobacteriota bacterium]|nr:VCBS repeat-containing protein [Acidobacteriota bacterium]
MSFAGTWIPADSHLQPITFWNVMRLGAEQREGVVVGAWIFNTDTSVVMPDVTPTRAAVFEQQADGTLQDATARVFGDSTTYGVGDVMVADFNGDNRDDVLLPPYNESPFLRKPAVAYVSEGDGLRKITTGAVMAHHTSLYQVDGIPRAISQSFPDTGRGTSQPVVFQWSGNGFITTNLGDVGGMSVVVGNFTNTGDLHIVTGDSSTGPGRSYSATNPLLTFAYKFNHQNVTLPAIPLPKPYFNDKPEYAQNRFGVLLGGPLVIPKLLTLPRTNFTFTYNSNRNRGPFNSFGVMPSA